MDHASLPFSVFPAQRYHAENDELVTCCCIPAVMVAGLFFCPVELLDEGVIHLSVSCVEVFHARGFDVASFQTSVVWEDGGERLEAVFGLQPSIQLGRKDWI